MTTKYNSYQVICIGAECKLYEKCGNKCLLKRNYKSRIEGCNYSNIGDCELCSYKKTCMLIKPYSEELYKIEVERSLLENENKKLEEYISEWEEVEENLDEYDVNSVNKVIYFEDSINSKQKMIDKIYRNNILINAYLKKEKDMIV